MKLRLVFGLIMVVALATLLFATDSAGPVQANGVGGHTHFRYGHYSVTPIGGNTVQFTLQNAWRRDAGGNPCVDVTTNGIVACSPGDGLPQVGDVIREGQGGTRFDPGDGSGTIGSPVGPLYYLVTSVAPANNWLFGLALDPASLPAIDTTISHTYAVPGNYTAFTNSCCRISALFGPNAHINNGDGGYRVETIVNVGTGNRSPVSALPPIILCPIGALCTFTVPAADADGDAVNFRMSAPAEASSSPPFSNPACLSTFCQPGAPGSGAPNPASISAAGVYTWDTTGATLGPVGTNTLYSTQVTLEDLDPSGAVKSKAAVDFLIQLVPCPPGGCIPPVFPPPPGVPPVCNTTQLVNVGGTLTFAVQASDPNAGDTVTLNVAGLPPGATMAPALPTSGNPVSSSFSWTPTPADVGTIVVTFTAASPDGSALCPVTINVVEASIEKELLGGPEEIGIYLPEPTQYVFEIAYTGPTATKVIDTVPAEFECVNLVPTAGTATCSDTSRGAGNSANRIEWDVPAGSNTLTVTIQTVGSPGRGHKAPVFKPTSCGPLPINDGATAFEVDPVTGELVLVEVVDPVTGEITLEPVVIVGPSNALQVTAVTGTKTCDAIIDADGTATPGDGVPGAVEVTVGTVLAPFPTIGFNNSGLDMFDNDGNGAWTFGPSGDDLHVEGTTFCPTAIRDGVHQLGLDCKVLDIDGSLFTGQPVSCDLEVGAFCVPPLPSPIMYNDVNGNNAWDDGEDIVLDVNGNGVFD